MKTSLILIATVGTAFAAPAFAADTGNSRSVEVRYHDLDLASAKGAAALDRRIGLAADQVCGTSDMRDLRMRAKIEACRQSAIEGTRTQVAEAISSAKRGQDFVQAGSGLPVSR